MIWLEFAICAALIVMIASRLARYSDVLADKTGLGRAWAGAILLAGVTSLPELVSGISAVTWLGEPNLAIGAVLGSCLFNIVLIAIMDLVYQPGPLLSQARDYHILSGGLGVLLLGVVAAGILLGPEFTSVGILGVSLLSLLIFSVYGVGARLISRLEQKRMGELLDQEAQAGDYAHISPASAWAGFILSALAVVALGIWLASIGDRLAAQTGLSSSFVGSLFLATSTSLPEVAASLAAIRFGAIDLAIANVLGSNLMNVAILSVYDVADGRNNLWEAMSQANALSAVMCILMTAVVIISLIYRASPRTPYRISWDGLVLLGMYVGTMLLLYGLG
jgi:cation:H+ antiporter